MDFFPYDRRRLRCHPLAVAVVDKQAIQNLTIKSTVQLKVKCSRCSEEFKGRVFHLINQTNQCSAHKDKLSKKKSGYNGHIPSRISRPIRAGLLLGVERDRLVELVMSLQSDVSESSDTESRKEQADQMIRDVREKHTDVQLADNCYWGDKSTVRKNGSQYRHPSSKRSRADHTSTQTLPLVCDSQPLELINPVSNLSFSQSAEQPGTDSAGDSHREDTTSNASVCTQPTNRFCVWC